LPKEQEDLRKIFFSFVDILFPQLSPTIQLKLYPAIVRTYEASWLASWHIAHCEQQQVMMQSFPDWMLYFWRIVLRKGACTIQQTTTGRNPKQHAKPQLSAGMNKKKSLTSKTGQDVISTTGSATSLANLFRVVSVLDTRETPSH